MKEHETYLASDDYAKWHKEHIQNESCDIMRNDPDPQGWKAFMKVIGDGTDGNKGDQGASYIKFLEKVGDGNPKEPTLQLKLLKFYITLNKGDLALKSLQQLMNNNPSHILTYRAVSLFESYSSGADVEINKAALGIFTAVILKQWKDNNGNRDLSADKNNMENSYQILKVNSKTED